MYRFILPYYCALGQSSSFLQYNLSLASVFPHALVTAVSPTPSTLGSANAILLGAQGAGAPWVLRALPFLTLWVLCACCQSQGTHTSLTEKGDSMVGGREWSPSL